MPRRGDADAARTGTRARAEDVLAVVRDVPRHAEFSPEVVRVRWRDGRERATAGSLVGARFAGWSRTGPVHWLRTCEVVADDPRTFAWVTLPTWWNHDATLWRVDVAPADGGCVVTLSYEVLADAPWFIRIGGVVSGRVRRLPATLGLTVEAIARAAARRARG